MSEKLRCKRDNFISICWEKPPRGLTFSPKTPSSLYFRVPQYWLVTGVGSNVLRELRSAAEALVTVGAGEGLLASVGAVVLHAVAPLSDTFTAVTRDI